MQYKVTYGLTDEVVFNTLEQASIFSTALTMKGISNSLLPVD